MLDEALSNFEQRCALKIVKHFADHHVSRAKKHSKVTTLTAGFPPHEISFVLAFIDKCLKCGWLEYYETSHDKQVRLTIKGAEKFAPILKKAEEEKMKEYGLSRVLSIVI